jgi:hypothetical protein
MELYRNEQDKWVYYAFGANGEVDLACLGVHFPVAEAYDGIDPKEDFFQEQKTKLSRNNERLSAKIVCVHE